MRVVSPSPCFVSAFVYLFENFVFNTKVNNRKFSLSMYKVYCIVSINDVIYVYVAAKYPFYMYLL